MKFRVSDDRNFLILTDCTANELEQLQYSFTKKIANWYIIKKKRPSWDGEVSFIDKYQRVPIGLWMELKNLCQKFHFQLEIDGIEHLYDKDYNQEEFEEWAYDYFESSNITPYEYQVESASRLIKFRNCTQEVSTSGGKTLIAFLFFKYLLEKGTITRMLYVVPNINLVTQTEEKFYQYEGDCGKKPNWTSECVFGGSKGSEGKLINITFGTYQSLSKKPLEYFAEFDAVCIDETHHAKANSIKTVLVKCVKTKYKHGLTGTLPPEGSCDSFTIQSYLGPKVYTISSADLISSGRATPVQVIGIELDYLEDEVKKKLYDLRNVSAEEKDGAKLLNLEKDVARSNRKRFLYVVKMIQKTTKNSLILFADIKNEYGREIYNWLRENTNKNVYYIDGGTGNDNREYYKKKMEEQENTVIVASVGVFSEGVDVHNVHNIFITESHRSEFIVRQILGRGMRLKDGKDQIIVIDFRDNYEWGKSFQKKNYLMRHAEAREKIYKDKQFPFKVYKEKL